MQFGLHSILIVPSHDIARPCVGTVGNNAESVQQEYVKPRRLFAMSGAVYSTCDASSNENPRQAIENLFNF